MEAARQEQGDASSVVETELRPSASQVGGEPARSLTEDVQMIDWDGLDPNQIFAGDTPDSVYMLLVTGGHGLDEQAQESLNHYLDVPGIEHWFHLMTERHRNEEQRLEAEMTRKHNQKHLP